MANPNEAPEPDEVGGRDLIDPNVSDADRRAQAAGTNPGATYTAKNPPRDDNWSAQNLAKLGDPGLNDPKVGRSGR